MTIACNRNYSTFRQSIVQQQGKLFSRIVEALFEQAIEFAGNEQIEDALAVGNDALTFAKYSDAGYANLYLVGLLCQASLDNRQLQSAKNCVSLGMEIIQIGESLGENKESYENDMDAFLDLKVRMDKKNDIENQ
ncbi:MAG: hypothetical protein LBO74_03815 [Candidatus Symbiothrix sp.]|nr:hypothetical protein [Candidatus Symbiothrix sp.]